MTTAAGKQHIAHRQQQHQKNTRRPVAPVKAAALSGTQTHAVAIYIKTHIKNSKGSASSQYMIHVHVCIPIIATTDTNIRNEAKHRIYILSPKTKSATSSSSKTSSTTTTTSCGLNSMTSCWSSMMTSSTTKTTSSTTKTSCSTTMRMMTTMSSTKTKS